MGKIVRSAKVVDEKYLVNVPLVDSVTAAESPMFERDDRFDASFEAQATYGGAAVSEPSFDRSLPVAKLDWEALRADAEAIVDRAAADAEQLIMQAQSTALELIERAQARVEEIESEARSRGHDEGFAAGHAQAQDEMEPQIATVRELIESIRAQRRGVIENAEPELVRLAMAIAERIVHSEVASNAHVIVENVRHALTRLVAREAVILRVNPADLDAIRAHRDSIVASSDVEHLRIVEDQRVDRGGVVVETESGTIDAKIATQLREARRAILSDDSIELGPSAGHELRPPAQAS